MRCQILYLHSSSTVVGNSGILLICISGEASSEHHENRKGILIKSGAKATQEQSNSIGILRPANTSCNQFRMSRTSAWALFTLLFHNDKRGFSLIVPAGLWSSRCTRENEAYQVDFNMTGLLVNSGQRQLKNTVDICSVKMNDAVVE